MTNGSDEILSSTATDPRRKAILEAVGALSNAERLCRAAYNEKDSEDLSNASGEIARARIAIFHARQLSADGGLGGLLLDIVGSSRHHRADALELSAEPARRVVHSLRSLIDLSERLETATEDRAYPGPPGAEGKSPAQRLAYLELHDELWSEALKEARAAIAAAGRR